MPSLPRRATAHAATRTRDALQHVELDGVLAPLRAGIHWGQPRRLAGDYVGIDVNVAARIDEAANAGQVLVSDRALAVPLVVILLHRIGDGHG